MITQDDIASTLEKINKLILVINESDLGVEIPSKEEQSKLRSMPDRLKDMRLTEQQCSRIREQLSTLFKQIIEQLPAYWIETTIEVSLDNTDAIVSAAYVVGRENMRVAILAAKLTGAATITLCDVRRACRGVNANHTLQRAIEYFTEHSIKLISASCKETDRLE